MSGAIVPEGYLHWPVPDQACRPLTLTHRPASQAHPAPLVTSSGPKAGKPAQRAQPRHESVLAASCDHELRQASQSPCDRTCRDCVGPRSVVVADEGIADVSET